MEDIKHKKKKLFKKLLKANKMKYLLVRFWKKYKKTFILLYYLFFMFCMTFITFMLPGIQIGIRIVLLFLLYLITTVTIYTGYKVTNKMLLKEQGERQ